jgi:hypothetical protein
MAGPDFQINKNPVEDTAYFFFPFLPPAPPSLELWKFLFLFISKHVLLCLIDGGSGLDFLIKIVFGLVKSVNWFGASFSSN